MKSELFKAYINMYCEEHLALFEGSGFIHERNGRAITRLDSSIEKAWMPLEKVYKDRIYQVAPWAEDLSEICHVFNLYPMSSQTNFYTRVNFCLDIHYFKEAFFEEFTISRRHFPCLPIFDDHYANTVCLCFNTDQKTIATCIKGSEVSPENFNVPKSSFLKARNRHSDEAQDEQCIVLLDIEWHNLSKLYHEMRNDIFTKTQLSVYDVFLR